MPQRRQSWQTIAHEAQQYRDASISRIKPDVPQTPSILPRNVMDIPAKLLSPDEIQITELPVEELADMLQLRKLTAMVVTLAFLRRAGVAQKLVCSLPQTAIPNAVSSPNKRQECRPIVSQNSCQKVHLSAPAILMNTMLNTGNLWVRCMVFRSA